MKFWHILAGTVLTITVTGASMQRAAAAPAPIVDLTSDAQHRVTGTVSILQRMALPPDTVLTVTLSDASVENGATRVLAQQVWRTAGKQPPFHFSLPYQPAEMPADARIILSAVLSNAEGRLMFVTDRFPEVINRGGTQVDLTLVPMAGVSAPAHNQ